MRYIIYLLLAYAVAFVSSFSTYGAYERVFYWYAYQVDADVHDGVPQTIAPGCWKNHKRRCTFAEFIAFIEKGKGNTQPTGFTDNMLADDRAQRLYDQQFTGTYDSTRIIEGVSDGEQAVVRIMNAISPKFRKADFLAKAAQVSQENLSQMRTAIKRVHFLRGSEYAVDLKAGLESEGVVVKTSTKRFRYRLDEYADFVNIKATRNANPSIDEAKWKEIWTKIHGKGKQGTLGFGKLKIHGTLFESVKETMSCVRAC